MPPPLQARRWCRSSPAARLFPGGSGSTSQRRKTGRWSCKSCSDCPSTPAHAWRWPPPTQRRYVLTTDQSDA
eukprot:871685-Prorocentrum_minimum.AAC.1